MYHNKKWKKEKKITDFEGGYQWIHLKSSKFSRIKIFMKDQISDSGNYILNELTLLKKSPASASSFQVSEQAYPHNAFDGDLYTRWSSEFSDEQWLRLDLSSPLKFSCISLDWEKAYAKKYKIEVSSDRKKWTTVFQTDMGNGGNDLINTENREAKHIKLTCLERGTPYGYSLWELGFWPSAPVSASSVQNNSFKPGHVIDGDLETRWASQFLDRQWLLIDYQKPVLFNSITIYWEAAYAKSYEILTSIDEKNWETVYSTDNGKGGKEIIPIDKTLARFIKIRCIKRATGYGFSINEIDIGTESSEL